MARYQPPHMRNRPSPASGPGESSSSPRASGPIPQNGYTPAASISTSRALQSTRDRSAPARSIRPGISAASSAMRPSTRTDLNSRPKTLEQDMEFIQSVSRSGGDGAEGDALKDWALQERYRKYIDERLEKHYAIFPGHRNTPPPSNATDQLESLGSIVLLFRKLREGVVASGRVDLFAIEVFESSVKLGILARNTAQVISSLSGLVPGLYLAVDAKRRADLSTSETTSDGDISDSIQGLYINGDQYNNRAHFASLLLLFYLCHSDSIVMYFETLTSLTRPIPRPLHSPLALFPLDSPSIPVSAPLTQALLSPTESSLRLSRRIRQYMSPDRFDPIRYWRSSRDSNISSLERAIIAWSADRVRERAWEVMKRAYMDVSLDWAGGWLGLDREAVESWIAGKGARVEGGRVKLR